MGVAFVFIIMFGAMLLALIAPMKSIISSKSTHGALKFYWCMFCIAAFVIPIVLVRVLGNYPGYEYFGLHKDIALAISLACLVCVCIGPTFVKRLYEERYK
jgi:hypothetical protein